MKNHPSSPSSSFSLTAWRKRWLRLVPALAAALLVAAWTETADAACYVAFVHGKRDGTPTVSQVEAYWNPAPGTTAYDFVTYAAVLNLNCKITRIRYDGTKAFHSAATTVGADIANFVATKAVPAGQLLIITHSMGGLVVRYGLNNASSLGANWSAVRTATKYVITSQTPHLGSKAADAAGFEADGSVFGDITSYLRDLSQQRNAASDAMRRVDMEYAGTAGGLMNDIARTKRLYTIEGYRVGALSGAGPLVDVNFPTAAAKTFGLDLLWGALCYKPHVINGGLLCPTTTPGDGLVEQLSAAAIYYRDGTWDGLRPRRDGFTYFRDFTLLSGSLCVINSANPLACQQWASSVSIKGRYLRWLKYGGDHQQGAWDYWKAPVQNYLTAKSTTAYLASYIGQNGHTLAP